MSCCSWRWAVALRRSAPHPGDLWPRIGSDLKAPVAVYVAAIFAMGVTALTTGNALVIAGAVMFMASDALLATEKFLADTVEGHRVWMRYAVWVLYYVAQMAIAMGFLRPV
jgi:uncharacterized membrane protein YhhN